MKQRFLRMQGSSRKHLLVFSVLGANVPSHLCKCKHTLRWVSAICIQRRVDQYTFSYCTVRSKLEDPYEAFSTVHGTPPRPRQPICTCWWGECVPAEPESPLQVTCTVTPAALGEHQNTTSSWEWLLIFSTFRIYLGITPPSVLPTCAGQSLGLLSSLTQLTAKRGVTAVLWTQEAILGESFNLNLINKTLPPYNSVF